MQTLQERGKRQAAFSPEPGPGGACLQWTRDPVLQHPPPASFGSLLAVLAPVSAAGRCIEDATVMLVSLGQLESRCQQEAPDCMSVKSQP